MPMARAYWFIRAGEGLLGAGDRLAERGGGVVGRLDRGGADQVAQLDLLAGAQPEPRRRLGGGVLRRP